MKNYFHFSPRRLKRRLKKIILFTVVFCSEMSVAGFFVLIFNFLTAPSIHVITRVLAAVCGVILSGMLVCLGTYLVINKKIRRESRYTYVDIQEKAVIFSVYGGEYRSAGDTVIVRDVYYAPFSRLKSVRTDLNGKGVTLEGDFRHYCMNSENLGYHIKDGDVVFDREWLNIGGFEQVGGVKIPDVFGKPEKLCFAVTEVYKSFLNKPKPAPYVFKEADFIRRRSKPRVMPEQIGYKREW